MFEKHRSKQMPTDFVFSVVCFEISVLNVWCKIPKFNPCVLMDRVTNGLRFFVLKKKKTKCWNFFETKSFRKCLKYGDMNLEMRVSVFRNKFNANELTRISVRMVAQNKILFFVVASQTIHSCVWFLRPLHDDNYKN